MFINDICGYFPECPMKKKPMPRTKETSANMKGINASMLRKAGIMKNIIDMMSSTIPTTKLYVLLSMY